MNIRKLPYGSAEPMNNATLLSISNAFDYAWRIDESELSYNTIMRAEEELRAALMAANTPNLDRVLAVMAAHDPKMMNTEL